MSNVGGLTRRGRAGRVAGASWEGGLLATADKATQLGAWEHRESQELCLLQLETKRH